MYEKLQAVVGTLFVDLDGTVLHSETEKPLEGAVEKLKSSRDKGWMIVLTTYRGNPWGKHHKYGVLSTLSTLRLLDIPFDEIVWNSPSPRVLINDEPCHAIPHQHNGSWTAYDF